MILLGPLGSYVNAEGLTLRSRYLLAYIKLLWRLQESCNSHLTLFIGVERSPGCMQQSFDAVHRCGAVSRIPGATDTATIDKFPNVGSKG